VPCGNHGSIGRSLAHVEVHEYVGNRIVSCHTDASKQFIGEAARSQLYALDPEKCHFLSRIEPPQIGIEFQTIDHARPIGARAKEYMLRAKIAVAVDEVRAATPEKRVALSYEFALCANNFLHATLVQP
jgi:hypothetical protein